MPLRDHFRPPLGKRRSYEELFGAWPATITVRLNAILPQQYYCGPNIRMGTAIEVEAGAHETENAKDEFDADESRTATAWGLSSGTLLLDTVEWSPSEYEALVYDEHNFRRLVAAIELVSPGNKDRPQSREAFVSKCHSLLQQGVCVAIIDPVTDLSANLFAELADRIGAKPPAIADAATYAVSCRVFHAGGRTKVASWPHKLAVGSILPTLPLWLSDDLSVPLELERTYEETCRGLKIG